PPGDQELLDQKPGVLPAGPYGIKDLPGDRVPGRKYDYPPDVGPAVPEKLVEPFRNEILPQGDTTALQQCARLAWRQPRPVPRDPIHLPHHRFHRFLRVAHHARGNELVQPSDPAVEQLITVDAGLRIKPNLEAHLARLDHAGDERGDPVGRRSCPGLAV